LINMKSKLKIEIVFLVIGLLIGVNIGWLSQPVAKATQAKLDPEYTFYYISHGGPGDPWWGAVIQATKDASKLLKVETHYMGPERFSIEKLTDMLESAIATRPDGIILTITAVEPLDPLVRKATKLGIPVVAANIPDSRSKPERMPYIGYVGQDEYQAGVALAKRVLEEFTPKRGVIGMHEPGHIGHEMRADGIEDVMSKRGIPVEKLDITPDPAKAIEVFRSYFVAHPDTEVIFTLGPLGAHPAIDLVRELGKVGEIRVATIDIDDKILVGIKDGIVLCGVSQQPYMQGFIPVVWLYLHKKYGFIPPEQVATGPAIIDLKTIDLIEHQLETTGGA
jgi:simple sugar transport system substrate-binding protein